MKIPVADAAPVALDAQPIADRAATEYLEAEFDKIAPVAVGSLAHTVLYVGLIHGELSLREMQIVCEVAAYLRLKGG